MKWQAQNHFFQGPMQGSSFTRLQDVRCDLVWRGVYARPWNGKVSTSIEWLFEKWVVITQRALFAHPVSIPLDTLATNPCITSGTGTPINESSSDYVWDVFYHRPASLSEWNSVAARTGTMCVSAFANFVNYRLWVQVPVYLAHSSTRMIQIQDQKQKTRLMRIRMVGAVVSWFPLPWVFPAEEYYKNDYPDEDYDSESASGLSHYHLEWCWPDQC